MGNKEVNGGDIIQRCRGGLWGEFEEVPHHGVFLRRRRRPRPLRLWRILEDERGRLARVAVVARGRAFHPLAGDAAVERELGGRGGRPGGLFSGGVH